MTEKVFTNCKATHKYAHNTIQKQIKTLFPLKKFQSTTNRFYVRTLAVCQRRQIMNLKLANSEFYSANLQFISLEYRLQRAKALELFSNFSSLESVRQFEPFKCFFFFYLMPKISRV